MNQLAREIEYYSKLCYERFLVRAAGGNLSVRRPDGQGLVITPTGVSLRDVKAGELVSADLDGRKTAGPERHRPSKEVNLHQAVYRLRPEAMAVVHVHPAYATAFATLDSPFPMATSQARFKLGRVPIAAYADPGSQELVRSVEAVLASAGPEIKAVLLRDHGLLCWDVSLGLAFDTAELVEETAIVAAVAAGARG